MRRRIVAGLTLLGVLAGVVACFSDRTATGPKAGSCNISLDPSQFGSTLIVIESFSFQPTPVHVPVGGKATWLNCEPAGTPAHTTTADGGVWNSPLLDPGQTYTVTFNTAGTFAYHCEIHPSMIAQMIVDP